MPKRRAGSAAALLADGRMMIIGGQGAQEKAEEKTPEALEETKKGCGMEQDVCC